jgi:membrane glycosyltransferase
MPKGSEEEVNQLKRFILGFLLVPTLFAIMWILLSTVEYLAKSYGGNPIISVGVVTILIVSVVAAVSAVVEGEQ